MDDGLLGLDCAATLFALGRAPGRDYVIRLAAALDDEIDLAVLQEALDETVAVYPFMFSRLVERRGSLSLAPAGEGAAVRMRPDTARLGLDCAPPGVEAQVTVAGDAVVLEFFHGVADGRGGLAFLLRLVATYLARLHGDAALRGAVPVEPADERYADGYRRHARGYRGAGCRGGAYRIRGTAAPVSLETYRLSAAAVRDRARRHRASVTEYLAALLMQALRALQLEEGRLPGGSPRPRAPHRVRLSVPVDLRPRLSCRTVRNCTLNVYPELGSAADADDTEALCRAIGRYMREAVSPKRLSGRCAQAVLAAGNPLVRALPLPLCRAVVRAGLAHGRKGSTMTFSNLGVVALPARLASHVTGVEMAFSPRPEAPYSCAAVTLGDELRLTLARGVRERRLEPRLERVLAAEGLAFSVDGS